MADVSEENKRQHKRFRQSCEIDFRAGHQTYSGMSEDFSINGLLIRTDTFFGLDTVLYITVHLPDGTASELIGKVRRIRQLPEYGAKFGRAFKGDMGIEIMERDANYMKFFMSLLSSLNL